MNTSTTARLALALTLLASLVITAQATPSLVINELSDTLLSYSWSGGNAPGGGPQSGMVTATTPDHWTISINDAVITGLGGSQYIFVQWAEPDPAGSGLVNLVTFYQYGPPTNGSTVTVTSDNPIDPNRTYPTLSDGATYTFDFADAYTATFHDNGDSSVPDSGATTFCLSGMAVVAVTTFRRFVVRTA